MTKQGKMKAHIHLLMLLAIALFSVDSLRADAPIAIRGETIYTMAGEPITDGIIIIRDGKIDRIGKAADIRIADDVRMFRAKVVTPGLIDAHATIGLTGYLNQRQDQDIIEHSEAIQPELRAFDAYNPRERLVEWARSFGVTTIHTGHAPGEVISGQTMIVKLAGDTVDDAVVRPEAMIACTLGDWATHGDKKAPGTRSKAVAILRSELIKAQAYVRKIKEADEAEAKAASEKAAGAGEPESGDNGEKSDGDAEGKKEKSGPKKPDRNLRLEALGRVINREIPLLVTAHRANDISVALRLAKEFDIDIVLDGAAEAHLLIDEIKAAGVPVIIHPSMIRSHRGTTENASFETAAKLVHAGIPVAMQSGYEDYVPKTRVVLFETAIAAANGLSFEEALATCTINAAKILKIDDRVGSLEVGKDADIAMYDGDPFEYMSHCTGVVINGAVVSEEVR
ncbi:MAG: amidohydrolase family protein [Phycisphaerales bacterium]|nr:amidohydrolase family protein [Phycisphaerales bacterium]MCB9857301.1 amidohydrolase family protein [Phycisphaerales bacterium]MCB9862985.1 amidohydrolase family protein [Phycisphaerales bacterium]